MKLHDSITDDFKVWMEKQHVFFVATAPLGGGGHVNVSPKGYDAFRIIDEKTVCYMDMCGSGNETSAHINENERITIMFCGFEGGPRILRLYGKGEVILPNENNEQYKTLISKYYQDTKLPGTRQIIINHVERIQSSCGYGVPFMDFRDDRSTLVDSFDKKGEKGCEEYMRNNARKSIDGLPTPQGEYFDQEEEEEEEEIRTKTTSWLSW